MRSASVSEKTQFRTAPISGILVLGAHFLGRKAPEAMAIDIINSVRGQIRQVHKMEENHGRQQLQRAQESDNLRLESRRQEIRNPAPRLESISLNPVTKYVF